MAQASRPTTDRTNAQPMWQRYAWLLPALLAVVVYAPAPWSDLVWDDQLVIQQQLPAFGSWLDAFRTPADIEAWSTQYYRPVVVLSYLLDRALYGTGPAGLHVTNVLLHTAATLALYALLGHLLASRQAAFGSALAGACLFAVHPIHTESVSWMAGRSDVLATMFLLPAITLSLRWRDDRSATALAASALMYFLALAAKETAIAGLAIIPATLWLAPRTGTTGASTARAVAGVTVALVIATAAFLALREIGSTSTVGSTPGPWPEQAGTVARAIAFLAIKTVWPWPQLHFVTAASLPGVAATALALAGLAALLVGFFAWCRRRGDGLPLLSILWFGAAAAPAVAAVLFGVAETPVAERYLYLPSAGLALLFSVCVAGLARRNQRTTATAVTIAVVLVYGTATVQRGFVWLNDRSLWSNAVEQAPNEALPINQLAAALNSSGDRDGALDLWMRARPLARDTELAGIIEGNIGLVYLERNDYATARGYLEEAIRLNGAQHNARRGLGAVLFTQAGTIPLSTATVREVRAMLETARAHYEAAIRLSPASVPARLELALVLARLGDITGRTSGREAATGYYAAALDQMEWVFDHNPAAAEVPATRMLADQLRAAVGGRTR